MRRALEFRASINLAVAALVGVVGLHNWPFPSDNAFLTVVDARKPWLFEGLAFLYATLWFSTPLIVLSVTSALLYVAVMRGEKRVKYGRLPGTQIRPRGPSPSSCSGSSMIQHGPSACRSQRG